MTKIALGVAGGILLALLLVWSLGIAAAVGPAFLGFARALMADVGFWVIVGVVLAGTTYYFVVVKGTHTVVLNEQSKRLLIAVMAVFVPLGLLSVFVKGRAPEPTALAATTLPAQAEDGWLYDTQVDQMSGATTRVARLPAQDTQMSGEPFAWLIVTDRGDVFVEAEGITCSATSGSVTRLRLDDGPVEQAQCIRETSRGPDTVWLNPIGIGEPTPAPYLPRFLTGQRLVVNLPTYEGDFQAVFDVEGLAL